jgi:hypothetical protein
MYDSLDMPPPSPLSASASAPIVIKNNLVKQTQKETCNYLLGALEGTTAAILSRLK